MVSGATRFDKRGRAVADDLAAAQALRYAEELRSLYAEERKQRRTAERALEQLGDSYSTTVRALAAALELRDDETGGHAERVTRLALELARSIDRALAEIERCRGSQFDPLVVEAFLSLQDIRPAA